MEQIQEKKRNVGAGFLTDQGALFLIAGELGVQLKHMTSTDLTLKDIYAGANDITIVARVLAIYPISEYKKKDGGVGSYRRLSLFDKSNVVRLTIWDDNQDAMKLEGDVCRHACQSIQRLRETRTGWKTQPQSGKEREDRGAKR